MKSDSYLLSLGCGDKYFHNKGTAYTTGRKCDDCGRFIPKDSLKGFMTNTRGIWMTLWNRQVAFKRGENKKDISLELKELMDKLENDEYLISLNKQEAEEFKKHTYELLDKYSIRDDEATIALK